MARSRYNGRRLSPPRINSNSGGRVEEPEDFDETVSPFEPCSCTEDLDCPDFDTHAEAQACFDYCGGVENDVHRLDRDKDGLACESLG